MRTARDTRVHCARAAFPRHRSSRARAVRPLPRPARLAAVARALVHEPSGRHARGAAGGTRHRLARLRWRSALADDLDPDRNPLGTAPAFAPRPGDDVRGADRHLCASRLDRPARRVLRRLQAASVPDHGVLRVLHADRRLRRPDPVGLPSDASVGDVRRALRSDVRADDPRLRDRDARRGLRPHRSREGRARDDGAAGRMSSATRCCRS